MKNTEGIPAGAQVGVLMDKTNFYTDVGEGSYCIMSLPPESPSLVSILTLVHAFLVVRHGCRVISMAGN